jgi:HEAT repeat protein
VLIAGLEDGRRRVREAAVLVLERVGTVEAIGALLPMVADPRGVGRERVEPAIGRIDTRS